MCPLCKGIAAASRKDIFFISGHYAKIQTAFALFNMLETRANLAGYISTFITKDSQPRFLAGLHGVGGAVVILHGAPAGICVVGRCTVVDQAVEEETATRLERHGHGIAMTHVRIADLPIAALKVDYGTLPVRAGLDHHAAIFHGGLIQGNPGAHHGSI